MLELPPHKNRSKNCTYLNGVSLSTPAPCCFVGISLWVGFNTFKRKWNSKWKNSMGKRPSKVRHRKEQFVILWGASLFRVALVWKKYTCCRRGFPSNGQHQSGWKSGLLLFASCMSYDQMARDIITIAETTASTGYHLHWNDTRYPFLQASARQKPVSKR